MIPKDYWEAWALNLSGVRVQEDISEITRYHRIPGSKDYYSALEYVRKRFEDAGFDKQEMFEYPADGEYHSGMWELDETMVRRKEENKSNQEI